MAIQAKRLNAVIFHEQSRWSLPGGPPIVDYDRANIIHYPVGEPENVTEDEMYILRRGEYGVYRYFFYDTRNYIVRFTDTDHKYTIPSKSKAAGFEAVGGKNNVILAQTADSGNLTVEDTKIVDVTIEADEVAVMELMVINVITPLLNPSLGFIGDGPVYLADHVYYPMGDGNIMHIISLYASDPGNYKIFIDYYLLNSDAAESYRSGTWFLEVNVTEAPAENNKRIMRYGKQISNYGSLQV